jgi:hypothetical protein
MKRYRLPKPGRLVEPEDRGDTPFVDTTDVEGHGLPTTAPPGLLPDRSPGHGGEAVPDDDDDVEGHLV